MKYQYLFFTYLNKYLNKEELPIFYENHPNQPHLIKTYQINIRFPHFHGIWDNHICTTSNRCCAVIWFQSIKSSWFWFLVWFMVMILWVMVVVNLVSLFIYFIFIFILPTHLVFGIWKQHIFDILFFTNLQKMYLKKFS